MIAYISIGNSDDKLTQMNWGKYYRKVDLIIQWVRNIGGTIHGRWASQPTDYWQNACWCIEFPDTATMTADIQALMHQLTKVAGDFGQDSIAWAVVDETYFLRPEKTDGTESDRR